MARYMNLRHDHDNAGYPSSENLVWRRHANLAARGAAGFGDPNETAQMRPVLADRDTKESESGVQGHLVQKMAGSQSTLGARAGKLLSEGPKRVLGVHALGSSPVFSHQAGASQHPPNSGEAPKELLPKMQLDGDADQAEPALVRADPAKGYEEIHRPNGKSGDSRAEAEHSGSEAAGYVRHSSTLQANLQPVQAPEIQRDGQGEGQANIESAIE